VGDPRDVRHLRAGRRPQAAHLAVIYNVLIRQIEIEYLRFAARYGVHTTVYNPLAGGLLGRNLDPAQPAPAGSRFATNALYTKRYWTNAMHHAAGSLRQAADAHGLTTVELAYGWVRTRPGVDSVLVGPGSLAHLDAALAAWEKPMPAELLAAADAVYDDLTGTNARYAR